MHRTGTVTWRACCAWAVAIGLVLLAGAAAAQNGNRLAAQLDRPSATRKVPPKPDADATGQIACTFYPDLMVRETGTDTPAPDAALLVRVPPGSARPACDAQPPADSIMLDTENFSFIGRKSGFLLFSATDPNGAVPFLVLDAETGRLLYADGTAADRGIRSLAVRNGTLHLRYTRGINAPCSLMQDAVGCWARLLREGKVPGTMAQAPSAAICAASYKTTRAPPDVPSIIVYDMDMTVDAAGRTQILSQGPVSCAALP